MSDDQELAERYKQLNYALKSVRISIEWNYADTTLLFKALGKIDKKKALAGVNALKLFTVATLFKNFHVWLYGCQTSNYFNISFDEPEAMLTKYINQEDFDVAV